MVNKSVHPSSVAPSSCEPITAVRGRGRGFTLDTPTCENIFINETVFLSASASFTLENFDFVQASLSSRSLPSGKIPLDPIRSSSP